MENVLFALVLLACPIGMGLCMWMMAKGMRGKKDKTEVVSTPQAASLEALQQEQQRLQSEIDRLREPSDGIPPAGVGSPGPS
jgi:hypothetical protein